MLVVLKLLKHPDDLASACACLSTLKESGQLGGIVSAKQVLLGRNEVLQDLGGLSLDEGATKTFPESFDCLSHRGDVSLENVRACANEEPA